jgi:hypothetical protein
LEVRAEFDKAEQLEKTRAALLANEVLEAVFDLSGIGSGFIRITNRRLMFQDRRALTSYPYHQVAAISAAGGWLASTKLVLTTGGGVAASFPRARTRPGSSLSRPLRAGERSERSRAPGHALRAWGISSERPCCGVW